jgi:hypothetical protein
MGYHNAPPIDYAGDYWAEYEKRDATEMGKALTRERWRMVQRHTNRLPVDIGIGAGAFVLESGGMGYDVNQTAIDWLKAIGRYCNPYQSFPGCMTFWDALEHIPDPGAILSRVLRGGFVFVSLPVFDGFDGILKSRHYKPGEHIWYWTHDGFLAYMEKQGFACHEWNNTETKLGRDGILSYAFQKR